MNYPIYNVNNGIKIRQFQMSLDETIVTDWSAGKRSPFPGDKNIHNCGLRINASEGILKPDK